MRTKDLSGKLRELADEIDSAEKLPAFVSDDCDIAGAVRTLAAFRIRCYIGTTIVLDEKREPQAEFSVSLFNGHCKTFDAATLAQAVNQAVAHLRRETDVVPAIPAAQAVAACLAPLAVPCSPVF